MCTCTGSLLPHDPRCGSPDWPPKASTHRVSLLPSAAGLFQQLPGMRHSHGFAAGHAALYGFVAGHAALDGYVQCSFVVLHMVQCMTSLWSYVKKAVDCCASPGQAS
eukprot:1161225-Pelagomonas_calceolata.AAC.18